MKKCARARPSYEAPSRRRYVKETGSGVYFKPKKKDTQNVVYELYGSGGIWGKVSAGQGDFNCMHERKVVCGRRDGRHADWLHATNGPIPTEPNPSDIFKKKKKKNREFFLFRNNSLVGSVCRAVPVFLTGADLSFHSFTFYWDVFFLVDAAMEFPN